MTSGECCMSLCKDLRGVPMRLPTPPQSACAPSRGLTRLRQRGTLHKKPTPRLGLECTPQERQEEPASPPRRRKWPASGGWDLETLKGYFFVVERSLANVRVQRRMIVQQCSGVGAVRIEPRHGPARRPPRSTASEPRRRRSQGWLREHRWTRSLPCAC